MPTHAPDRALSGDPLRRPRVAAAMMALAHRAAVLNPPILRNAPCI